MTAYEKLVAKYKDVGDEYKDVVMSYISNSLDSEPGALPDIEYDKILHIRKIEVLAKINDLNVAISHYNENFPDKRLPTHPTNDPETTSKSELMQSTAFIESVLLAIVAVTAVGTATAATLAAKDGTAAAVSAFGTVPLIVAGTAIVNTAVSKLMTPGDNDSTKTTSKTQDTKPTTDPVQTPNTTEETKTNTNLGNGGDGNGDDDRNNKKPTYTEDKPDPPKGKRAARRGRKRSGAMCVDDGNAPACLTRLTPPMKTVKEQENEDKEDNNNDDDKNEDKKEDKKDDKDDKKNDKNPFGDFDYNPQQ